MASEPKTKKCPMCSVEYTDLSLVVCPKERTLLMMRSNENSLVGLVLNDRYQITEEIYIGHTTGVGNI